jgi:Flp pilus assembly protein TadG
MCGVADLGNGGGFRRARGIVFAPGADLARGRKAQHHKYRKTLPRADEGIAAVEFAFVAPVLVILIVCTADLGLGLYRKMQVQNAAQAGAQYAAVHGFDSSSISAAVTGATSFSAISASPTPSQFCGCPSSTGVTSTSCSSTCSGGASPGTYVTVSATGSYTTLISYPGIPSTFTFTAQPTVRIQ